jgi:type I restriction enzyme, S subunit
MKSAHCWGMEMSVKNWIDVPLSTITSSLMSGSRPKGGVKGITEGIPSIGAEHLDSEGGFNFSNIRYIPEDFAKSMRRGEILKDDILIVKDGATTGKTSFVKPDFQFEKAFTNEHVFIWRTFDNISKKYIFHYLRSQDGQDQIMSTFHGGAQGGINSQFIDEVNVPLPPFKEQKRIVEKLDAVLPKVKSAKARLEKIPAILKKFRQSVLAAACSGRLTEDWREGKDIENDFKGHESEEKPYEVPENWTWAELRDLSNGFQYGTSSKSDTEGKIPVIRMGNLQNGIIDWSDLKFTNDDSEIEKYNLNAGDVLFNRTNSPDLVGKTSIYMGEYKAIFAGYLIRIKNKNKYLNSFYLNHCLNAQRAREWCEKVKTDGVSQSNINAQVLATFLIPLPPLVEQHEIVRCIEKLFSVADSLETKCNNAMGRVKKIEQAILAKAFRGELTEPDPDDEPAEELLQRVLEEKAKLELEFKSKSNQKVNKKEMVMEKQLKKKSLLEIIQKSNKGVSPENLFKESGFALKEIDKFYMELKSISDNIDEIRNDKNLDKWPNQECIILKRKK